MKDLALDAEKFTVVGDTELSICGVADATEEVAAAPAAAAADAAAPAAAAPAAAPAADAKKAPAKK